MPDALAMIHLRQQGIARLAAECLEIAFGMRVGGDHLEHLTRFHGGQCLLGAQDRQGALQARSVDLGRRFRQGFGRTLLAHAWTCRPMRSRTQASTPATALGNAATSVPPPIAMSGRPPPLPPTWPATAPTSSPALTRSTRSGVTPATRLILPSAAAASSTTADLSLSFSWSTMPRNALGSAPSRLATSR